ncbi:MAG TPA: twin-arginine translocation signal domain-containing protein [Candidatus Saccharimonadales bacterium]|jgi:hypothetical protein|nr:twin-arginine translocation signal domain-containing protein [Candidatus Saccharimonadales bacterium]
MKDRKNFGTKQGDPAGSKDQPGRVSRRSFVKGAAIAAAAVPLQPLIGGKESLAEASVISYSSSTRAQNSFNYRTNKAKAEDVDLGVLADNGDAAKFTDFSALYSKALKHDGLGVPNAASYQSFEKALASGNFTDFQNIAVGTPGGGPNSRENGPMVAFAFDLEGRDSHAIAIPPAPSVTSAETAAEQVEHYWAALLRDVPFTEYPNNSLVSQAVTDLNKLSFLKGSANNEFPFPVTAQNLFRGRFVSGDGNVLGPYISQFMVQPTALGAQTLSQQFNTFASGTQNDFMTTVAEYTNIANGGASQGNLALDATPRFIRNGRDLTAFTHVDVLYQSYQTAFLVLSQLNTPLNPGNPYIGSNTQKPFATLGGPDAVGTLAEMATRALKGAWFHKWIVNLRMRPEEYGSLVHAHLAGTQPVPQASGSLHADVLNSAVLPLIHNQFGTFLLPQAFPEGSPTHPCYPTGHGTVAGACITAIKFFFDCSKKIQPLLQAAKTDVKVPSTDGLSLNTYTGSDAGQLDINGELNKLAWNVSVGHGIHAGIHFRSSTYESILLGEKIALAVLRDRAQAYAEPFSISITKFDGTTTTITNENISDSTATTSIV